VHFSRSLCTNVVGEAWRAAGTGLRRAMCWRSSVMRSAGSTGLVLGVSTKYAYSVSMPTIFLSTNFHTPSHNGTLIIIIIYGPVMENNVWRIRHNEEINKLLKEDIVRFIKSQNKMVGACRKNGR
jgi:hypothetical protein